MKLRYTLRGAAELDKVLVTIEERSPQGARHVQARIQAIINLLLQYPHAGQPTSKGRLRRVVAFRRECSWVTRDDAGHIVGFLLGKTQTDSGLRESNGQWLTGRNANLTGSLCLTEAFYLKPKL